MHRAIIYVLIGGRRIRVVSQVFPSWVVCSSMLDRLCELPGVSGHVETKVPGQGWVVDNDNEVVVRLDDLGEVLI